MDIKINELKDDHMKEFVITVDSQKWTDAQKKTKENLAKNIDIKGFRKGKAPKDLIEARLSDDAVMNAALEAITPDIMTEIMTKADGVVKANPIPSVIKKTKKELELSLKFFMIPEITLPDVKKIKFENIENDTKATKEEVENEVVVLLNQFAKAEAKNDAAAKGDIVTLNFEGFLGKEAFEGGKAENHDLEIGSNQFIPGFEDQLVGTKKGDKKDVKVTFPKDYPSEKLADKEVTFKCEVLEVKVKNLPKRDDAFIKTLNAPFLKTFADLEKNISAHIEQQKTIAVRRHQEQQIVKFLVEESKVTLPKLWVDSELKAIRADFEQKLAMQGMDIDSYCEKTGNDIAFIEKELKVDAESKLKVMFILAKIKEDQKIKVTAEEAQKEIEGAAKALNKTVEAITEELKGVENFRNNLETKKVFDWILTQVK